MKNQAQLILEKAETEQVRRKRARNLLGVTDKTTPEQIKEKYHELARKNHPDRNHNPDATTRMAQINEAYRILQKSRSYNEQNISMQANNLNRFYGEGSPFPFI
ncbi:MAG: DnaJ domain-containing protein [Candidatus Nanoarchaeia archaeon]